MKKARVIAFYLPQYHPIPENDEWWGKGFTEWTNVGKAKPLFNGHYQPRVPADLGYYDLRMPEIRIQQAELAKEAGIEGFCYWRYWFGNGRQLLELPFNEMLKTAKPDFPFCVGWANHSWTNKSWKIGKRFTKDGILMEQKYSIDDHIDHFNSLLEAFKDPRYIKVDNKPLFVVFNPRAIPDVKIFIDLWNDLALKNDLNGIHFVGICKNFEVKPESVDGKSQYILPHFNEGAFFYNQVLNFGFNAVNSRGDNLAQVKNQSFLLYYFIKFLNKINIYKHIHKFKYKDIIKHLYVSEDTWENVYPTIIPNWDRSPRSGKDAIIWHGSTPDLFYNNVVDAIEIVKNKSDEHKIIFLQSWNEWAEGNYMEPDIVHGKGYLEALRRALLE